MVKVEEAQELAEAEDPDHVAQEAADVLYFTMVRMAQAGVTLADVEKVLDRRSLKVTRRKGDAKAPPPRFHEILDFQTFSAAHVPSPSFWRGGL